MHHYTYLSIDENDGRMYIGSRSCKCKPIEDTKYFGSYTDKTFKPTIKKILKIFNAREDAFKHEIYLHFVLDVAVNSCFANKARATTTGFTWAGQKHTPETIKKIQKTSKNMSLETKEKIRRAHLGKKLSKEHVEALRKSNIGCVKSPETRKKISEKAKGRKCKDSARQKISEHNKGKWINRKDQSKAITLENIQTKEIKFFVSQKEAVRVLGVHQASLNRVATGKQYSCRGWILYKN